jgi:hypothetical protein
VPFCRWALLPLLLFGGACRQSGAAPPGAAATADVPHAYVPPAGFVPDSLTAVRIAEAVWTPIYGAAQIQGQRPFRASLHGDVWTVEGSLPQGWVGGVALAELSKRDGRILRVSHGR